MYFLILNFLYSLESWGLPVNEVYHNLHRLISKRIQQLKIMKDETDSSSDEEDSESDEGYADEEYTNSSEDDADDEEEWFFVYKDIRSFTKYIH